MYADPIVYATFEKDAYCCTAVYGENQNSTISVHNYATIGAPNGTVYTIDGYAYQDNLPEEPGQLKVVFSSEDAFAFPAPYWVLDLGPVNGDGLYDWAIVSDNLSLYLFVLARNVDVFNAKYDTEVTKKLTELGFTGATAPVKTYHGKDCVYESAATSAAASPAIATSVSAVPETVSSLDVDAYMGLWYQVFGDKFIYETTSPDSYCATAKYWLQEDGTIGVHNYQTTGSPTGEPMSIDGYAYYESAAAAKMEPGQLKLHFDVTPVDGSYWVLALGPIVNGFYEWAVVSDPTMLSLFILARDVETFYSLYEQEVIALVESLGFTKAWNKPLPLYQGDDCNYEVTMAVAAHKKA
jgi:lipocalin